MKKSVLTLAPRLIPVSSKEEAMLSEALGLIDYFHPHMRKQAMNFARAANLKKAVDILGKLEQKRKDDYARANAPTLFEMGVVPHPEAVGVEINGKAFDIPGRKR